MIKKQYKIRMVAVNQFSTRLSVQVVPALECYNDFIQ